MKNACGQGFPWGTLAVNVVGCFVFGVLFALFAKNGSINSNLCLLLTTGVCGGFTTFSTFAHESMQLLQNGNIAAFAGYVAASLLAGLSFVALGYLLVK
jgi:CrcB protein